MSLAWGLVILNPGKSSFLVDFSIVPEEVLAWASHALGLNPHFNNMSLHQVWCLDLECTWCEKGMFNTFACSVNDNWYKESRLFGTSFSMKDRHDIHDFKDVYPGLDHCEKLLLRLGRRPKPRYKKVSPAIVWHAFKRTSPRGQDWCFLLIVAFNGTICMYNQFVDRSSHD